MRFGELAGLRLSDVRLLEGELTLRRQWTGRPGRRHDEGRQAPHRRPRARRARRRSRSGSTVRGFDEGLLFERETTGGHLDNGEARKLLYGAMKRAGVDRIGEQGGARDWHSFRHTFARIALENGALIQWVHGQLGH